MRYFINFDKTINQLTPHYIGGRKLILLMQALVSPLQSLSNEFSDYADEQRIEASMTSQIFPFTWFLNRKFRKYFLSKTESISISNSSGIGVPLYNESADVGQAENLSLYSESEGKANGRPFYQQNEKTEANSCSFIVHSPAINVSFISKETYTSMLTYWIEKYRLAGKTYKIVFD